MKSLKIIDETKQKIQDIEVELKVIATQLDVERKDSIQDDNLTIHNELLDKKQYLEEQLYELNKCLARLSKNQYIEKKTLDVGMEAIIDINGRKKNMTIVSSVQADPTKGLISAESPLGQALLGKKAGSQVKIETPAGEQIFNILKIQ